METTEVRAKLARMRRLKAEHVRAIVEVIDAGTKLSVARLREVGVPETLAKRLLAPKDADHEQDLQWIASSGVQVLLCTDPSYPTLLLEISAPPPVLFVLGLVEALNSPQLAMVGSRTPTVSGRKIARDFAVELSRAGLTITSGLAQGVDAASHEGALSAEGLTIAVFGTGLDAVYPTHHQSLAARIKDQGALVSEFPPRTPPLRRNFPQRNRIISGLSRGTLVVEAAERSGSLSTANWAAEQGREVFAIPSSIHNEFSRGCHKLIREGATLVDSPAHVLAELRIPLSGQRLTPQTTQQRRVAALDKGYEMLLDALGFEPATIDDLMARTGFSGATVASMLLNLELEGCVAALPGGRFDRIPE